MLFVFPTLIFILVFALALKFSYFKADSFEEQKKTILYKYPEGIEEKIASFPIPMTLIIFGTVMWAAY